MGTESKRSHDGAELERAVILQLLDDDHKPKWSRADLMDELDAQSKKDRDAVERALRRLEQKGVLESSEEVVWASSAARHLDELEMIAV